MLPVPQVPTFGLDIPPAADAFGGLPSINPIPPLKLYQPEPEPTSPDVPPNPIDERVLKNEAQFKDHVRRLLDSAIMVRRSLNQGAQQWRRNVRMERRSVTPWADAPNITSPLTRQKTDGVEANIITALDQEPFFAARPLSDQAQYHQMAFEATMEKEMDKSGARGSIHSAIQDAVQCGTGMLRHVVVNDPSNPMDNGMPGNSIAEHYVRFEDVYAFPDRGVNKRSRINHFERYAIPWWDMDNQAEEDRVYDRERLQKIKNQAGTTDVGLNEEDIQGAYDGQLADEERYHEVWHCEVWWQRQLWWVEYHRVGDIILAAYPHPWQHILGGGSYRAVYIKPRPGYYYGDCIPEILEPLQEVSDALLNTELAAGQFKMQPPIFVRRGSVIAQKLKKKGYIPGGILEVDGNFDEFVKIQEFRVNPFNVEFMRLIGAMAEDATFNDLTMPGAIVPGDRTATEVQTIQAIGTMKLRMYLMAVRDCLRAFAAEKWQLIFEYVVKPRGICETYEGNDAARIATTDALVIQEDGTMVAIPGGLRDDMQWEVRGNETAPGKAAKVQQIGQLIAQYPVFQQARTDRGMYFLAKALLEFSGIYGYKEIIGLEPPPPTTFVEELQKRFMAAAQQMMGQGGGLPAGR